MADDVFDADWLTLREGVDHRSRATALEQELAAFGAVAGWSRAVDLGCGTGSNLRHLAPRLSWVRHWTLVDHDAGLLARVTPPWAAEGFQKTDGLPVPTLRQVEGTLEHEGLATIAEVDLVTASALLDLVTASWLDALVERVVAGRRGALFALSYSGHVQWQGAADSDDAWMASVVNRHQQGEKPMGRALGPAAVPHAERAFTNAGYRCVVAESPWVLDAAQSPQDLGLALAWLEGWVSAARQLEPLETARIDGWAERRRQSLRTGQAGVRIGHFDLLALPPHPDR